MQQVIPGLWIGDYEASQDAALLRENRIECIVSAMRQEYDAPGGVDLHRVLVDDTETTNIAEHFVPTAEFIQRALDHKHGVLVHCQAGVSRSTTLVAAFLMHSRRLNVEQAIDHIRQVRPQVDPTQFFLLQLEMFERCNCEWDPVKWPEERRFLMSFAQSQIMEGASPSIVLAYYPSPAPSPRDRSDSFGLSMTPLAPSSSAEQVSPPLDAPSGTSALSTSPPKDPAPAPARKRLTPRKVVDPDRTEVEGPAVPEKAQVAKIGTKDQVKITGRRIRCKMCRRELAAREHIVAHEPGKGQQAFAPNRRDMNAYRAELEKQRLDRLRNEAIEEAEQQAARASSSSEPTTVAPAPAPAPVAAAADPRSIPSFSAPAPPRAAVVVGGGGSSSSSARQQPPTNPLAHLRISQPLVAGAGGRVAVPRPVPVARPSPRPNPSTSDPPPPPPVDSTNPPVVSSASSSEATTTTTTLPRVMAEPRLVPPPEVEVEVEVEVEAPLLSSHVCSSYFVEPLSWMSPFLESGQLAGKITCPGTRCGAKLGNFDWAGNQCSCGAWVCPGFALNVSRVDEIKL